MSEHRYPATALLADYARAAIGLTVTGGPLLLSDLLPAAAYILGALALMFLVYGLRTALRHMTTIELSDAGIRSIGPFSRAVRWDDVREMTLKFYSTRRDRRSGWMQLKVAGPAGAVSIDSSVEGFDEVARRAAIAAGRRGVSLAPPTLENLKHMGIDAGVGTA